MKQKDINGLDIKKVHERFRELRENTETNKKSAISQRDLAKQINVAHSRISKLENEFDTTIPSLNDLIAYRDYFNVSIDYLLGFEDEPTVDVDLRAISKEFGVSAKALNNIRDILMEYDSSKRLENCLNVFLESKYFVYFLSSWCDYYEFENRFFVDYTIIKEDEEKPSFSLSSKKLNLILLENIKESFDMIKFMSGKETEICDIDDAKRRRDKILKENYECIKKI